MRLAAKRDANEREIVLALRRTGALVLRLGLVDLLVFVPRKGRLYLLEVKSDAGKLTKMQTALQKAGWPIHFVCDVRGALQAIEAI